MILMKICDMYILQSNSGSCNSYFFLILPILWAHPSIFVFPIVNVTDGFPGNRLQTPYSITTSRRVLAAITIPTSSKIRTASFRCFQKLHTCKSRLGVPWLGDCGRGNVVFDGLLPPVLMYIVVTNAYPCRFVCDMRFNWSVSDFPISRFGSFNSILRTLPKFAVYL